MGFSLDQWLEDTTGLSSLLLSVMRNWEMTHQKSPLTEHKECERQYDVIRNAILGFESDLHNLAVNYQLMIDIIKNNQYKDYGLRGLYIGLLTENYITNIRSLYDFCSIFPRIIMSKSNIDCYCKFASDDTLWTLLCAIEGKAKERGNHNIVDQDTLRKILSDLPDQLKTHITNTRESLQDISRIRNAIVHHGKEPFVKFEEDNVVLRIPKESPNDNSTILPNILNLDTTDYPLFDYLKKLTCDLFAFMENLGVILFIQKEDCRSNLWQLVGICMEDFCSFMNFNLKRYVMKDDDGALKLCYYL